MVNVKVAKSAQLWSIPNCERMEYLQRFSGMVVYDDINTCASTSSAPSDRRRMPKMGCGTESYATEDNYIYTMQFICKECLELITYRGSEDAVGVLERADDIR